MLPIVISLSITLLGVLAAVALVWIATRGREEEPGKAEIGDSSAPSETFFLDDRLHGFTGPDVSPKTLRDQLEKHVRTEQEAAEGFLDALTEEDPDASSDPEAGDGARGS